jgi:phosphohistidine phosphatase
MILYMIRHAIAEQADPKAQQDDSQRPLTAKGRRRMRRIARGLMELRAEIDLILTSPYLRAADTARIVAKQYGLDKDQVIQSDNLAPAGHFDLLITEISQNHGGIENLALVGHEPYLSSLVSILVSGGPNMSVTFKKGGVCRLAVERLEYGRCASLDWLLTPAQLVEIGG